jgi:hypothetical protein
MHRALASIAISLLSCCMSPCAVAENGSGEREEATAGSGWVRLFDGKSLDGWYTKLQNKKKNEDPEKYFQVEDGAIHVYKDQPEGSQVASGYLASEKEFAAYHLRLEFKWGSKKFRPRTAARRDAGLLYHVVGPDTVWPRCIECQIQENDVGDCFTVGTQAVAPVETVTIETPSGPKKLPHYKPEAEGGVPQTVGDGTIRRVVKSSTHEHDGWNTVEIVVRGSEGSEHIVNGHRVFEANTLRQLVPPAAQPLSQGSEEDKKKWQPLSHGRIALQCEFAEVYYRSIEIRPIPEGPLNGDSNERGNTR